jgi:hypothetical protein
MCKNLEYVFIRSTQIDLYKCITWPKKIGKGRQEWNTTYVEINIHLRKLSTPMKIINFFLNFKTFILDYI